MSKKIMIINTKGGSSKSTFALQVAATYFLKNGEAVKLIEFDDENRDSENFVYSSVKTKQIKVEDGKYMSDTLREELLNGDDGYSNIIFDVGGNKTTIHVLNGFKKSMLFSKVDLIIIPMSGGSQDFQNAVKTYNLVKEFNIPIIFGLSRVRNLTRILSQYKDYFQYFVNEKYMVLTDSDVIDLSRELKKSVYEIGEDSEYKHIVEAALFDALRENDNNKAKKLSIEFEILNEAVEYCVEVLSPAWNVIDSILINGSNTEPEVD